MTETTEKAFDITPKTYSDTSFVTGDSPATHDFNGDHGYNASKVTVFNDGAGDFTVALTNDGTTYGGEHTMKNGESVTFTGISVDSIRVTWVADSSYRILAQ